MARRNPRSLLTPATLHILLSLADGERHGYGIKQDVEERTGGTLRLGPGTLYEAVHRLLREGFISEAEEDESDSRRRVYRLTARGREQMLQELQRLAGLVHDAERRGLLPSSTGGRR